MPHVKNPGPISGGHPHVWSVQRRVSPFLFQGQSSVHRGRCLKIAQVNGGANAWPGTRGAKSLNSGLPPFKIGPAPEPWALVISGEGETAGGYPPLVRKVLGPRAEALGPRAFFFLKQLGPWPLRLKSRVKAQGPRDFFQDMPGLKNNPVGFSTYQLWGDFPISRKKYT